MSSVAKKIRATARANPRTDVAYRAALLGILVITVIWSLNWTVGKVAMRDGGPFTFSALRYLLGTAGLFALLMLQRRPLRPTPWLPTLAIGLSQTVGFQIFMQWSLVAGGAGRMALLAYSMPFFVIPLAWWWLDERPGAARWICIMVAAVGYLAVVAPWQPIGSPESIAMALASGLCWAIAAVVSKATFQRHPHVRPLDLTAWQMLFGTCGLVVIALLVPEEAVRWTASYVGALLYSGLLASSIAWVAWAVIVRHVPASVAGLASLAVPIGGVLFAWALLGEQPTPVEWLGIVLIGGALLSLNLITDHDT